MAEVRAPEPARRSQSPKLQQRIEQGWRRHSTVGPDGVPRGAPDQAPPDTMEDPGPGESRTGAYVTTQQKSWTGMLSKVKTEDQGGFEPVPIGKIEAKVSKSGKRLKQVSWSAEKEGRPSSPMAGFELGSGQSNDVKNICPVCTI